MKCALCNRLVHAKGLCQYHYVAAWREKKGDAYKSKSRQYNKNYARNKRKNMTPKERQKYLSDHAKRQRAWRADNREMLLTSPKYNLRYLRRYGLLPEDYDLLLKAQDGGCAICKTAPGKKRLAVDHCHKSGRVRGLLCEPCNHGLGKFGDEPARLRAAAMYLDANSS